eukprot:scaffold167459_cov70-Attheya_sp.AAC.9
MKQSHGAPSIPATSATSGKITSALNKRKLKDDKTSRATAWRLLTLSLGQNSSRRRMIALNFIAATSFQLEWLKANTGILFPKMDFNYCYEKEIGPGIFKASFTTPEVNEDTDSAANTMTVWTVLTVLTVLQSCFATASPSAEMGTGSPLSINVLILL